MKAATAASGGAATWRPPRSISGFSETHLPYKAVGATYWICCRSVLKKRSYLRHSSSESEKLNNKSRWLEFRKSSSRKSSRSVVPFTPLASNDDSVAINGTSQRDPGRDIEEVKFMSDQSFQAENLSSVLAQSLHDAARSIELAFLEHSSLSKSPWFSRTWLGVDRSAWIKILSYQAAVHSLLQAAIEISSRGDGRDRDTNLFVQRSLLRLCAPLESIIHQEMSAKQPSTSGWFWSHQHPMVVTTFVNIFEKDPHFTAATALYLPGKISSSGATNDLTLLMLTLSCLAAVMKLGSAKISSSQFSSMLPDVTGRLMDVLLDFLPISKVYDSMKDIGLRREFLFHFGPRAASVKYKGEHTAEEISFWINLLQKQLQLAIDRERIWAKLTTCESIEVLEKDLAIFGFFIALGRSSQAFLSSNGFTITENPLEGIIRYLIGGSVLFYPQLSSISSYQLYVEVVCEELEWVPFYGGDMSSIKLIPENVAKQERISHEAAICHVLDVCSYWMTSFIKYSSCLENPSNIKATRFLSRGHNMLIECMKDLGLPSCRNRRNKDAVEHQRQQQTAPFYIEKEMNNFDKALESVEEALIRLENLLQELHVSSSNTGKEHLKAACSDLEKIRKLKKEAEFLEASFRAKEDSLEQGDSSHDSLSINLKSFPVMGGEVSNANNKGQNSGDRLDNKPRGFWSFMIRNLSRTEPAMTEPENVATSKLGNDDCNLNEIHRFEHFRSELIELERRVQQSTDDTQKLTEPELEVDEYAPSSDKRKHILAPLKKKDNGLTKSFRKIKETSTDVWQGTQLLAIDVGAAIVLLKRSITGDELTEKEKQALRRTLTDLAAVVPIGFLMLLPVTAVGHAAMLAAIQRYVPSLIPSTYARERIDLLRQLEKVKELEACEGGLEEGMQTLTSSSSNHEKLG
ncbi:hypothetical protein KSP39_PZI016668 [Platanthera zijinensis]|uniref:LETM1-like protein n=1 Tax=Platanthera zijinensis TaxID=2320716 RepID=A0AAP0B7J8_9ASPA